MQARDEILRTIEVAARNCREAIVSGQMEKAKILAVLIDSLSDSIRTLIRFEDKKKEDGA